MMMKLFSLLLASLVTVAGGSSCFSVFVANNVKGLLGGQNYSAVTTGSELITQSVPFYFSMSAATAAKTAADGRVTGFYSVVTNTGPLALNFYKANGWVTVILGRGAANFGVPNVITGGSGYFLGVQGTITRVKISSALSNYTLCPSSSKYIVS